MILLLGAMFLPVWKGWSHDPDDWLFPHNFPIWSLFFELAVNLVYGLIPRLLTTRFLAVLVAALALAHLTAAFWYGSFNLGPQWATAPGGLTRVGYGFFLGVLIHRLQGWLPVPGRSVNPWLLLAALAALLYGTHGFAYEALCVYLIFPLLIHLGASREPEGRSLRPFGLLGAISYAVYVIHIPLRALLTSLLEYRWGHGVTGFGPVIGLGSIALIVPAAWLLDRYYDAPVRRAIGAWRNRDRIKGR